MINDKLFCAFCITLGGFIMDNKKSFDKKTYDAQYAKDHYTQCKLWIKPDISADITSYCKALGVSKNKYIIAATLYCMNNGIELSFDSEK